MRLALERKSTDGAAAAVLDPPAAPAPARSRTHTILLPFEIKEVDEQARTFEGMAAAFSQDLGGDVILPGAFKRTISDWKRSGRILPLLDSHGMGGQGGVRAVIGKVLDAKEVSDGVWSKSQLIEGPDGDEVLRRVKGGYVDGLSIGYKAIQTKAPTEEEQLRGIWRFLKEVAWKELSVCIWPMNPDARIDLGTVKHLLTASRDRKLDADEMDELKDVHRRLSALLAVPAPGETPPAPAPAGLAPEDPRRLAAEAVYRDLTARSLSA